MPMPRPSPALLALGLLLLAWAEAWLEIPWVGSEFRSDPDGAVQRRADRTIAAVRERFRRLARDVDRTAGSLAKNERVRAALGQPDPAGARDLFREVVAVDATALETGGLEILRADGSVAAWNGRTPVPGDGSVQPDQRTRRIEDGPLHVWYVVAQPVAAEDGTAAPPGTVRVGVPVAARPGLHARFRGVAMLAEGTGAADADDVRIVPPRAATLPTEAGWKRAPLDPERPELGAIEARLASAERLQATATRAPLGRARALSLALVVALAILGGRRLDGLLAAWRPGAERSLALLPWLARFALLALGLPGTGGGAAFDPASYSNAALGGLLGTPAEFLLTAGAALASTALWLRSAPAEGGTWRPAVVAGLAAAGVAWLTALAAESAVCDSTLEHFDPAEPVPGAGAAALQAGLYLLALAGFLAATSGAGRASGWRCAAAFAAGVASGGAVALAAGPETIPAWTLAGAIAAYGAGAWLCRRRTRAQRLVLSAIFSTLLLHPCFDAAREEDVRRRLLQDLPDALAPQDGWFEHQAQEAAREIAGDSAVRTLVSQWDPAPPDPAAAVDLWRRSVAGLGCDAALYVRDARGDEITSIAVNFPPPAAWGGGPRPTSDGTVAWRTRVTGSDRVDVYAAQASVLDPGGRTAGTVLVALSPPGRSRPSMSFPEAVAPGRPLPGVRVQRHDFPGDGPTTLPAEAAAHFRTSRAPWHQRWGSGDRVTESVFAPEPGGEGIVALTWNPPGALDQAGAFFALLLGNAVLALAGAAAATVAGALARAPLAEGPAAAGRKAARFLGRMEHKLLAVFVAVSLAPILLLSVLSRALVRDRIESGVNEDAQRSAALARGYFEAERGRETARGVPADQAVPLGPYCRGFAALSGKDVGVYQPGRLIETSRPELFDLGILPRRVPARAYRALTMFGQDARLESWTAGRLQYRIAFQALVEEGRPARVFAVPVLFNRREVDEQTGRATVLIFGSYGLVLLVLWAGAVVLAERLTRPITRLLDGTRRVAAGELGFQVPPTGTGEMGELVEGFNRMIADLQTGRDNLARAEREVAWREMARQIAHEIKNPLTPMKLSAQEILRACRDKEAGLEPLVSDGVRMIVQQIDLLGRIATEFSTFARLPAGQPQPVDLNALARDAAALFDNAGPPAVRVALELEEALPAVLADPDEMRRVLTNLCRNAVQAMSGGGTITLRTRLLAGLPARVRVEIADTGSGIPPAVLPRIFEPYFSTRSDGTGLGLAICKRIVEDRGGSIVAESRPGEGARFVVELPA